ncbi:hypothetical protein BD408DRAFT_401989 [Parasitella parasitica]|nr:hypothetical protein BD408DRAFT_401989 [Parasitella parasitica]
MTEKKNNHTDSQVTEKARNQTRDEYSSSQSYEKDFDTAPNRDNLLSDFEDDLEVVQVGKNLQEPDGHTDEYNSTQQYKNPTMVGDLKTKLNEAQNLKDIGTSNSFKVNYTSIERPQVEASSSVNISSSPSMDSKYAHITLKSLRAKEMKYELMIQTMRDQVVDLIESDNPNSFQEVSLLTEKIKVMDGMLQGVRADLVHKDRPVQRNAAAPKGSNQNRRFNVPMERVPSFNIESCNYQMQAYQMKLTDTKKNVATFLNVKEFIEKFESIFAYHDYDINRHWEVALRQSFASSMDASPRHWFRFDYISDLIGLRQRFDESLMEFLQRFTILMAKAQLPDSVFMAIMCFVALEEYVKTYLKEQLPTIRVAQGNISPPVKSDAILPHENLQSIMELLKVHSSSVHRDLLERYQVQVEKQTKNPNGRKRGCSENLTVGPAASNDEAKTHPFKRINRRGHNTTAPFSTGPLCTHCEKVKLYPCHFCPERIAFQYARQNAEKGIGQPANINCTGTFAVRRKSFTEQLNDRAKNIMKILSQINPLADDDDMAEFLDESSMDDLDVPSSDNNGTGEYLLCGCDIFSELGITLASVAFDNEILYDDAVVDEKHILTYLTLVGE